MENKCILEERELNPNIFGEGGFCQSFVHKNTQYVGLFFCI